MFFWKLELLNIKRQQNVHLEDKSHVRILKFGARIGPRIKGV